MTTDKPSFQPLYQQNTHAARAALLHKANGRRTGLPSEWALAESLGVSQGTVRKALTDLVDEGWLYRQQGKGHFVRAGLEMNGAMAIWSPRPVCRAAWLASARVAVVHPRQRQRGYRQALSLRRAAPLFRVRLLWRLAGVAVALDDAYVPVGALKKSTPAACVSTATACTPAGAPRRRAGAPGAIQARATLPDRETMTLLGLSDVEPLLMITRLGQALTGEAVEWRERLCRSARWAFQRRTVIQHSMGWVAARQGGPARQVARPPILNRVHPVAVGPAGVGGSVLTGRPHPSGRRR